MTTTDLTTRLKACRESGHMTQAQLADRASISHHRVQKAERGQLIPLPDEIARWVLACTGVDDQITELVQLAGSLRPTVEEL